MDNSGGSAREVDLFGLGAGNFDGRNFDDRNRGAEPLEPDFSMQVTPEQMAAETGGRSLGQELNIGEMTEAAETANRVGRTAEMASRVGHVAEMAPEAALTAETERGRDLGFENAIGIATVGIAGEPTEAQMASVIPHDNRTADEIAIDAPEVARDGDKMEKDWMDRARRAINETKDDPHKRLLDAAFLREEYMRKRFNRILGERND